MSSKRFKRNFAAVLKRAGERQEQFVRALAINAATGLVLKSPVDTGRFRANWQFGVASPDASVSDRSDKTGQETLGKISTEILSANVTGGKFYITNNLPYAKRLEYGWSKQAPSGMVRLTLMELESYVRDAAAKVRGR